MSMLERTRRKCLEIRNQRYPLEVWPGVIHENSLREVASDSRVILEIGCGREATDLRRRAHLYRYSLGLDMETAAPPANGESWGLVRSDAHRLPVRDNSVDVVAMAHVAEHLSDPAACFAECARVLRPGGKLIILTVNKSFPPIVMGRILPHRVRQMINKIGSGTEEEDTFPAVYRANSDTELDQLGREAGFRTVAIRYIPHHPTYFMFSVLVYRMAIFFEQITRRNERYRKLRHLMHATFELPNGEPECAPKSA